VRQDIEFFSMRSNRKTSEYILPEGLIIMNDEGPFLIEESDMTDLTGINGSKILVGSENTIIIKNHMTDTLTIRAI
jgi:hypothetical protein